MMNAKKIATVMMAAATMAMSGCGMAGQQTLGTILSGAANGETLGQVIASVIGATKVTQKDLTGTWNYVQPGCAFTSQKLLAQAGGEVVAAEVKTKLAPYYQKAGVKNGNTSVTFNADGTFAATVAGKKFSGTYTYDEAASKITLQGLLLNINCYAKKNVGGMAILFESSKLLTLLQTMAAMSGNAQAQAIGNIAKSYDGLRVGFDMK